MNDIQKPFGSVYALGETVLDLVSDGGNTLQAVPGGSVLNASVSLGRMGIETFLISEYGNDKAGDLIENFLRKNNVHTDYCIRNIGHKTSLALAFLDDSKKASYSFYHDAPANLFQKKIPEMQPNDILLFGSFYAVKPERRDFLKGVLKEAKQNKAILYYDLNIRKNHSDKLTELIESYQGNMSMATIVKGSDEDFLNLFGISEPETVYANISDYCDILIVTTGNMPLRIFTPSLNLSFPVPQITPVSTIGAGDNFNAGFIYGLVTSGIDVTGINRISKVEISRMAGCGLAFATETCLSNENYIKGNLQHDFWKKYI